MASMFAPNRIAFPTYGRENGPGTNLEDMAGPPRS